MFALGERHGHKFAVASPPSSSPPQGAQTEGTRLAGGVTVLSALDPVRVHQDFAQLDLVSHGRAETVAGHSAFAEPFSLFGAPMGEYDDRATEAGARGSGSWPGSEPAGPASRAG